MGLDTIEPAVSPLILRVPAPLKLMHIRSTSTMEPAADIPQPLILSSVIIDAPSATVFPF